MLSATVSRFWHGLGTLSGSAAAARNFVYRSPVYRAILQSHLPRLSARPLADPWPANPARLMAVGRGCYDFAGQEINAVGGLPWFPTSATSHWVEEAHGFSWLRDLVTAEAPDEARGLVSDWIAHCGAWHPLSWRPDVLGRRLTAWLSHADFLLRGADMGFERWFVGSLGAQATHLFRSIDEGPAGAERFSAAVGLLYSGLYLSEGERRLKKAVDVLDRALAEQIFGDGSHIERSPSIHLDVLCQLIVVRDALKDAAKGAPSGLSGAIERMSRILLTYRHGDGGLALFNDSCEEDVALIETALRLAGAGDWPAANNTNLGFQRLAAGDTLVLMDAGMPPPAAVSYRAHAGLLAFELSDGAHRVIVNCGGRGGLSSDWVTALRATAAHSTVSVANTNSVGFADDGSVSQPPGGVTCNRHDENGNIWIKSSHDGYREGFDTVHERRLFLAADGAGLRGEDNLVGPAEHPFAARFHLHPGVDAAIDEAGVVLRLKSGARWRFRAVGGILNLAENVYMGRAGRGPASRQIVVRGTTSSGRTTIKLALTRDSAGD